MKNKLIITKALIILNSILILFLAINRIVIGRHIFQVDDNFLGMKFHAYMYSISRFSIYLPGFFITIFFISLLLRSNSRILQYLLMFTSFIGIILSWNAYDYFTPW
jgi:hypothetical protein